MLHLQNDATAFPVGPQHQTSAPAVADIVLHGVFHNGLENEPGNPLVQHGLVDLSFHHKPLPQPLLDNVQIGVHIAQFLPQVDLPPPVPVKGRVQHGGQSLDHGRDPLVVGNPGLPVDDLQSIIEKMGVDLALQGLDLRLLQGLLLLIGAFKLVFQLGGHGIEVAVYLLKFRAAGRLPDHIAPLPFPDFCGRLRQHIHGMRHIAVEQEDHHQQHGHRQQKHQHYGQLQLRHVPPQVDGIGVRIEGDLMAVHRDDFFHIAAGSAEVLPQRLHAAVRQNLQLSVHHQTVGAV